MSTSFSSMKQYCSETCEAATNVVMLATESLLTLQAVVHNASGAGIDVIVS